MQEVQRAKPPADRTRPFAGFTLVRVGIIMKLVYNDGKRDDECGLKGFE